ncbi:Short-chain dehydrogenases/reductases family protein [Penicillium ucsense]|uniref:Short-chain dehydrogenases/reductases family protein n=1 Tax=Penicillium ucsense TaxID=2839758 RepID=A0A8J8W821_9EURO|nr:Short-chain dehydrogenases/reductases family protein [Penicillium ucsense]KAF7737529.1 Short-chain dehydrogenases/reductases family protein [Penicillium ucsense]
MTFIDTSKDLPTLFKQQAQATPDAIALEDENTKYTYAELDSQVESLASHLRLHGVSRDSLVGVLLPRSAYYVIACLAALRAGGAFLVLELAYPAGLLADVIDDAKPAAIVTLQSQVPRVQSACPLVVLDQPLAEVNGHTKEPSPLPAEDDLDRLAFVSYSSGTTGKPKGIANPHRAPVLSYDLRFGVQDVQPGDRVACNVFFVWEMLRPLLRGATVVAVPDDASYDPAALVDLLAAKNITETLMTPTLLTTVLARYPNISTRLPKLRNLWLNGEVVTTDLARRAIKALPNTRLLNCYSACETHEIACGDIREVMDPESLYCPVGASLDPKHTYVLNESGEQVEAGIAGELFIGGDLLARGYLNLPETTAKAFTPNPFVSDPNARMYRTGDLARKLPSGHLEITGRVGSMIKLRGYSVVPAKVESDICQYLAVSHCAVIAHGEGLERQLVAYFVSDKEGAAGDRPTVEINETGHSPAARRILEKQLAHYMIPALWVEMSELPTHEVSGKVDLKSLPPPRSASPSGSEKAMDKDPISLGDVAAIWATVLKTSKALLKPEDNFFDLGGHSLSLADLASRLSAHFGFRVPIPRLADNTTLAGHLQTVRDVRDGHTAAVQADLPAFLIADSKLEEEIKPSAGVSFTSITDADTVLLTGATGFLGAFLLSDLLESTTAKIVCLVRFNDPEDDDQASGVARIRRNLLDLGLWRDTLMERVEILPGNLSRPHFGLSPDAFDELAGRVQVVVHAAATVNLVYPYAALRKANIGGTREILRLAAKGGATVQYVSTNGVLPPSGEKGWSEHSMLDVKDVPTKLVDGYGQTKWVAEQLVLEAGKRGLPVKIHRCGTISGHSLTGSANAWDLLTALLVESIRLGYAPEVEGWRAEMTPVDFVSKSIIHLATQTQADETVFHLGDPNPVNIRSVFENLNDLGYPTKSLSWEEWVALWYEKRGSAKGGDGSFTVDILRSGMPTVGFLKGIVVLDNSLTRPFREVVERPKVDILLLETYTRHWFARGWLPHAPARQNALHRQAVQAKKGPLSGKVAVVTGASSGIGAAVAEALAKKGCSVALGARRLDALESVKRQVEAHGAKCIIRSTDITSKAQSEALIQAANDELGPVDILVACAGVMYFTMMANVQTEEWERTVDVNCKGLLNALSSTIPGMLSRGQGHIVAISSDAGRKVFPGLGVYSASKFFVEATLQALRLETAGTGLRVTSIQPGNTSTPLLGMSTDTEAVKKYGEPSGAKILEPADVANSIVHALCQPDYVSVNEILVEPRDEPI